MSKRILIFAGVILLVVVPLLADTKEEVVAAMKSIEAERKALVVTAVQPSPQQMEKFQKAYVKYRSTIVGLNAQSVRLIEEYANSYGSLTDEQAERILKATTAIDVDRVHARKKCVKKLQAILVPKQVVRFLQIENKMDAESAFEAALAIPIDQ